MKCKECEYLRSDITKYDGKPEQPTRYGKYSKPCNRYPQNIMRSPEEPACGEFKKT